MIIEVYTFETKEGHEDSFTTQHAHQAEKYARENNLKCIVHSYSIDDSELAWDFTSYGD